MWKKTENRWWFPQPKCIIDIVYYIVIFVFHISQFVIDMQVPLIGFHHKTLLSLRVHAAYKARSQSFEILFTEGYFEKELCHPISESIKCWQECEQRWYRPWLAIWPDQWCSHFYYYVPAYLPGTIAIIPPSPTQSTLCSRWYSLDYDDVAIYRNMFPEYNFIPSISKIHKITNWK